MAETRADAAILLDSHGQLEGIVSDNDVARYDCVDSIAVGELALVVSCVGRVVCLCVVLRRAQLVLCRTRRRVL